ncbi:MAG: Hint domain-containing protein [Sandaracinaceae bacterium]|nr:Hint domain-containing protein [Sandaracinaceae bacterium]
MDAGSDAGAGTDAGSDAGTDAGTDAGPGADAGPECGGRFSGFCTDGSLMCLSCPFGGPAENYLCTTACSTDADCTDAARPTCNRPTGPGSGGRMGMCTDSSFICRWGAVCASPDTPIATPSGERPIAELEVGDLVYTMHEGALVARPLVRVHRNPVVDHAVVRAVLATGRVLEISGPHPTADGRLFSELSVGDAIDGVAIETVETLPYEHAYTHDILPDSDTGTYVAAGVLIGSTLFP